MPESRNLANIINNASVLYLSGLAVAIGFRMNLFNIGVDGQYRIAAFFAAAVGRRGVGCRATSTRRCILAAMLVGAGGPASPACCAPAGASAR